MHSSKKSPGSRATTTATTGGAPEAAAGGGAEPEDGELTTDRGYPAPHSPPWQVAEVTTSRGRYAPAMARTPLDDVGKTLQDVAYVSVGLGVLAFQRAQVRRQELQKGLGRLGTLAGEQAKLVEERVAASRGRASR